MTLDLTELAQLPGAPDENFEVLTRATVSRRFGGLGTLRERRQQPGVEFYLRVEHSGELGEPGRVWGWSCKWFKLNSDNELSKGQRAQIEDSIEKAIKYVDDLSDFVLCLPERPAKSDEEWIDSLGPARKISTKLWTAENYEAQLAGHDELRSTFFGEIVLTPTGLAKVHERSVAPIVARWVPALHTPTHVEQHLRRALLRPESLEWLEGQIDSIAGRIRQLRQTLDDIDDAGFRTAAGDATDDIDGFVAALAAILDAGRSFRPMEVRQRLIDLQPPATSPQALRALVLELRKRHLPAALTTGGLGAIIRDVVWWVQDARAELDVPLIALVGSAGSGKTHLAAQLTASTDEHAAGVFIQGGRLRAGGSLDDLARRVPGLKVDRFEDLLEALNSAGARAGSRLPLIIDGLNEAERPSEWRSLLDELVPALSDYPHVAVIVTLREGLAARALPDHALRIDLDWTNSEVDDIVDIYFQHYLIDASGAWLPTGMFHNPLFVRMYCEAANPLRAEPVGVEVLPTSLVGVFDLYRNGVVDRLAQDPARKTIPSEQITRRLSALALEIWDRDVRRLPTDEARQILDEGETNWDESLFRRLEEEGVLFRDEVEGSDDTEAGVLFDRFAGYLIADGLLVRMPYSEVAERLAEPALWESLLVQDGGHTFGEDVVVNLVGLTPRRFGGHHLWRSAPEEHRTWILAHEMDLESGFLDDGTVDELEGLILTWSGAAVRTRGYRRWHPFDRLWEVHLAPEHRLNAAFLDRVLRKIPLAERDRIWSEWVRGHTDDIQDDLHRAIEYWTNEQLRSEQDDLDALAISWLMTSTSHVIRDLATKALQRYGRPDPSRLFELASDCLDLDDLYVVERIIGAAFGAASAHQMPDPGGPFEHALAEWLSTLQTHFLEPAVAPTSHELLRSYIRSTFELAGSLHPDAVPARIDPFALVFPHAPPAPMMAEDDPNADECKATFRMDFENYVIGSAISGRRNYDFSNTDFVQARAEVMARVWALGWRAALLGDIDRSIAESVERPGRKRSKVERYGKKYGWIAYYELVGRHVDAGTHDDRWVGAGKHVSPDIDPTFPDEPPVVPMALPAWAPTGALDEPEWLRSGVVDVPDGLWAPEEIHGVTGGWLLIEGYLEHSREGRKVFGFFHTLLLESSDLDPALELTGRIEYLGNHFFPEIPTVEGAFAGEAPWSPRFDARVEDDPEMRPALREEFGADGIAVSHLAVELSTVEGASPTALSRSYDVPSFELAAEFGLRQLPGTLDLVGLDGGRASATVRADEPWRGQLLFVHRDLVLQFAKERRIVQAGWGEREVTVDWAAAPKWVRDIQQKYENVWREIKPVEI